ncbi:CTL-like protein DDB_G0274487 isoform X1 [Amborella trichopoda]|uniref:CTL-like protein DDB_G0274487 isoform X1 n=1 Tax=Amborella trichopoda TaxID=13333 RepID=UPI0009BFB244|nr:CTL-like protein DDB_G0274487 isoform X1 [Amborella trichopoda]|eukprot:XP_011629149.2 CTL-like protein DDB_G0274487 isoform X1 [Amborella trichopoda]
MQSPSYDTDRSSSVATREEDGQLSQSNDGSITPSLGRISEPSRHWRDVFWLGIFVIHLAVLGFVLAVLGLNRFKKLDRFKIDRYTYKIIENEAGQTETYWPFYALAAGIGTSLGWAWLSLLGTRANQMMKISVHILTTYLAVISALCFWDKQIFWAIAFAIGAALQFMYVMSVMDRFPFTMLVLQKGVKMVWNVPEVMRVTYAFMGLMLVWFAIWSFGVSGVVASSIGDGGCWWLLGVLSISLFWTGAVLCNTVHVVVSGMVVLVLLNGGQGSSSMPPKPLLRTLQHALTTSLGSICYGSLFTAAIRTLRWEIRGFRSKIGNNECLLCCVDFLFNLVETLVRFFNKYAYVQIAVSGKSFNHSARDAWELFQSTGIEALIAYDCSGAVLLMGTTLGGLITGTCAGIWTWFKKSDRVVMVGFTAMLMGMILVGLAMVVVESAVTSIYICYAEDPLLINRWDSEFFNQMSEALHERLRYRSARAQEVMQHNIIETQTSQETTTV